MRSSITHASRLLVITLLISCATLLQEAVSANAQSSQIRDDIPLLPKKMLPKKKTPSLSQHREFWKLQQKELQGSPNLQRIRIPNRSLDEPTQQKPLSEEEQVAKQCFELSQQEQYLKALPCTERLLHLREKEHGPNHSEVADIVAILAALHQKLENYPQAEVQYQQALDIWKKAHGPKHPRVATGLHGLAFLSQLQGHQSQAQSLYKRALRIREQVLAHPHPDIALTLHNLAGTYDAQGGYSQAQSLYERALRMREQSFGLVHPSVASSLNGLAGVYQNQGNYSHARMLYERTLRIRRKTLGPEHPDVATSLRGLAQSHMRQGNYAKAEPLYVSVLRIREKAFGPAHPQVANSLNDLATLYSTLGNYSKAESWAKRTIKIREQVLDPEHPDLASSLTTLAISYQSQGQYLLAIPLAKEALRIKEKTLAPDHPDLAASLNNLAVLYKTIGDYPKAESLYNRTLQTWERELGATHPNVATSLNNLAELYRFQGFYSKAEPLHQRALSIYEEMLGAEHPDIAISLNNLAGVYHSQGNLTRAHQLFSRAQDIEERNLDLTLSSSSESRKQAYISTLKGTADAIISFSLNATPESLPSARLAINTILRRKGRVLSSLTDSFQSLRKNLAPTDRPLLDQLKAIRSQQATLTFQGPGQLPLDQHQATLTRLKTQEDDLEDQLARKSTEFRVETQSVSIATVQKQIPKNAALVELVKYRPFNSKAINQEPRWETPHYAAYILKTDGTLQWKDLGEAAPIDRTVTQFRQALQSNASNITPIARKLDQQLMQPIRTKLGNIRQLLLSPDSQLNLIPFAALVDENNQYLVENYDITYLSSGRDLLKLQTRESKQKLQPPVIIANPDYQNPGEITKIASAQPTQNLSSRDLSLAFSPLPGTKAEAEQLLKLLPQSTVLTQDKATENALKQVKSPEILHIATHGFFLETELEDALTTNEIRASIGAIYHKSPKAKVKNEENPLLRSGLALAGANPRKSGTEDGIFTALEATNLNLQGTKLVVLSACETGLGDVANGEGVYGLRRAFVMAGAESQVLSLWKVDDTGTKDLMVQYYQRLLKNEDRGKALRQTQLEMLRSPQYQHPYYWAAFIPSGDWRSLR